MQTFGPGDRVVAINTDLSGPIYDSTGSPMSTFSFPDGPLLRDRVYHVAGVLALRDGSQGVFLPGMRVLQNSREMSWHHSRFRKVDTLKGHAPKKRRRKQPVAAAPLATCLT
jgi:hypothetical protein